MLVFAREGKIYTIDSRGDPPTQIVPDPSLKAVYPSFSHDGRCIYFPPTRAPVPRSGECRRFTNHGGTGPLESVDGGLLFYVNAGPQGSSVWCADAHDGPERQVAASPGTIRVAQYAPSATSISAPAPRSVF